MLSASAKHEGDARRLMDPATGVRERAFTLIEMVGVLFLAGLLAGLTTLSLSGLRESSGMDDVIDHA